jgi:hypothetical protein
VDERGRPKSKDLGFQLQITNYKLQIHGHVQPHAPVRPFVTLCVKKNNATVTPWLPRNLQSAPTVYATPRRWQRCKLDVPLRIILKREGGAMGSKTTIVNGRGNELNEGGMAVFAGVEARLGDELWVEFTPPYGAGMPIRVRAAVRNRAGYRYGIEFLCADPAELEQVERLREILRFASGS